MKKLTKIGAICILFISIAGCAVSNSSSGVRDGSSFEKAIIAKSIPFEYAWVAEHYPGSEMIMQSSSFQKKKPYDILSIKIADGEEKDVYFDISSFFGKF